MAAVQGVPGGVGAGIDPQDARELAKYKKEFQDFLDRENQQNRTRQQLSNLLSTNRTRLIVNINELREENAELAAELLRNPADVITAFEQGLNESIESTKEYVERLTEMKKNNNDLVFHVGFEGSLGQQHISPRGLNAEMLNKLICVDGIVTKTSIVRPKLVRSVHHCEATDRFHQRDFRDPTALSGLPTGTAYPTRDDKDNILTTEFGLCTFRDHQTVTIQEMPERSPAGQLPRPVDVLLDFDLVDNCKPGDRIRIFGVYRALGSIANGTSSGVFRTLIIGNCLRLLTKQMHAKKITPKDIANIEKIAKTPDFLATLSRSIAPSVWGLSEVKTSIVLLLVGGMEKVIKHNGMHLRGDINLLLVGDPSTAKSQLLRFILGCAPLAISTTGRGSSGVGLTAAVTQDNETGERRLEAGAMVLGDRGIVCIDEFDKMTDNDRVAIHEVMEQQTVTISKAGIHASLNARCSVVAAANPVYGQYNNSKKPADNIGLPDSLLSRFDLLFIILDKIDQETDRNISQHVLRMHQYRHPRDEAGQVFMVDTSATIDDDGDDYAPMRDTMDVNNENNENENENGKKGGPNKNNIIDIDDDEEEETAVFEKNNPLLKAPSRARKQKGANDYLTGAFLKKYITYVKHKHPPVALTKEACDYIAKSYQTLRQREESRTLPVTARTLETLIRLATAHAKCRLSREGITVQDAEVAMKLMHFALFQEKEKKKSARHGGDGEGDEDYDDDDDDDDDDEDGGSKKRKKRSSSAPAPSFSTPKKPSQSSPPRKRAKKDTEFDYNEDGDDGEGADGGDADDDGAGLGGLGKDKKKEKEKEKEKTKEKEASVDPSTVTTLTTGRKQYFKKALADLFRTKRVDQIPIELCKQAVNENNTDPFTAVELRAMLALMESEKRVMVQDDKIYLI